MNTYRDPLFLRFIRKEIGAVELINIFSRSTDPYTRKVCENAIQDPPSLEQFHKELSEAVDDIIGTGADESFRAFVNNYMEDSITEDVTSSPSGVSGENISRSARVQDEGATWVQGLLCYNLCLYLKVYGTDNLKKCKICGKVFAHKGQYAVYCSDPCKKQGKKISKATEHATDTKKTKTITEKDPNPGLNISGLLR